MVTSLVLKQMAIFAVAVFLLRLKYFVKMNKLMQMMVSITLIFIAQMEASIDSQLSSPKAYIQLASFFKVLKALLTIAVFTINGNDNDFFLCWFFGCTAGLGALYMDRQGFERPELP